MNSAQVGDKVRCKKGPHTGKRGTVERFRGPKFVVRTSDANEVIELRKDDVTNLSSAARKAWISMPNRQVGRPEGLKLCDRISVTLRIDRDLWREFQAMEMSGHISDRTNTINSWLRNNLAKLRVANAKAN